MAAQSTTTGAQQRTSDFENAPSRRGLILMAAATAAAGSFAAYADVGGAQQGAEAMNMHTTNLIGRSTLSADRSAWEAAMRAYETAKQVDERYDAEVYRPLFEHVERVAPRPDLQFTITAKSGCSATYHLLPGDLHEYDNHDSILYRRAAAEVRERWLAYRAEYERSGLDEVETQWDANAQAVYDAKWAVLDMPAPDHAALLWKANELFGEECIAEENGSCPSWSAKVMANFMADARRLLAGGLI